MLNVGTLVFNDGRAVKVGSYVGSYVGVGSTVGEYVGVGSALGEYVGILDRESSSIRKN